MGTDAVSQPQEQERKHTREVYKPAVKVGSRIIVIEIILKAGEDFDEIEALETLRQYGAADTVDDYLSELTYDEACKVLQSAGCYVTSELRAIGIVASRNPLVTITADLAKHELAFSYRVGRRVENVRIGGQQLLELVRLGQLAYGPTTYSLQCWRCDVWFQHDSGYRSEYCSVCSFKAHCEACSQYLHAEAP